MRDASAIEAGVLTILQSWVPSDTQINKDDKLVADLGLSYDATDVALDLERRFQVRIPRDEWSNVWTVQELINLFCRHVGTHAD